MAEKTPGQREPRTSVKGPLGFSAAMGLIAGVIATITATGGADKPLRLDLGLLSFGIAFIACLVVISLLNMTAKENPDHLGKGSGVNRSSKTPRTHE